MTMTRTSLSIRFVFILATVVGIHGGKTPREATLAVTSNFEDGLSDSEFRVNFPGVDESSAVIKIFRADDGEEGQPKVQYTIEDGAQEAKTYYFELKKTEALAGTYQVQVCAGGECSAKRSAFGKVLGEKDKPTLSCQKGKGDEENVFYGFVNDPEAEEIHVKINPGNSFLSEKELGDLPDAVKKNSAYTQFGLTTNPAYKITADKKNLFFVAVSYNGTHLKNLLDIAVDATEKQRLEAKYPTVIRKLSSDIHSHGYCSRRYLFWASAHIVSKSTNLVLRRFRGTIMPSEIILNHYILKPNATPIPVEFARYDDTKLPAGTYDVSVSFCASDKDRINSSVCSEAIHTDLEVV